MSLFYGEKFLLKGQEKKWNFDLTRCYKVILSKHKEFEYGWEIYLINGKFDHC